MSWSSVPIHVDGTFVGAVIPQAQGVRFVAIDWRVGELDQTRWATAEHARQAAEQMVRTGKVVNFQPPSLEE